jgi:hypothetical protein
VFQKLLNDNIEIIKNASNKDALFVAACSLGKEKIVKTLLPEIKDVTMGLQEALLFNRNNIVEILKNANYDKEKIGRLAFLSKKLNDKINSLGINIEATIETSEIKDLKNHYFNFLAHQPKNLTELFKQAVGDKNKFALRLARIIHAAIGEEEFKGEIVGDENVEELIKDLEDSLNNFTSIARRINIYLNNFQDDFAESDELELALVEAEIRFKIKKEALKYEDVKDEYKKFVEAIVKVKDVERNLIDTLNKISMEYSLETSIRYVEEISKIRKALVNTIKPYLDEIHDYAIDTEKYLITFINKGEYLSNVASSAFKSLENVKRQIDELLPKLIQEGKKIEEIVEEIKSIIEKEEEEVISKGTLPPSTYYTVKEITPKETEEINEKLF